MDRRPSGDKPAVLGSLAKTAATTYERRCAGVQRTRSGALDAVVVPSALNAVTLQLTLRRLRALPTASVGLTAFSAVPSTRHA
jgi:hypothetical protein